MTKKVLAQTHESSGEAHHTRMQIRYAFGDCSLGGLLVAESAHGVCAILMGDNSDTLLRDLERRFPTATLSASDGAPDDLVERVVDLIESPGTSLDVPLDIRGTAFQQRVWAALGRIPPGETLSYGELAQRIGAPRAARAVAGACAANPLAVAVPCHRVVRGDGGLAGYRWGVARKAALLAREAQACIQNRGIPASAPASCDPRTPLADGNIGS
ncbi:methylated-DNA--[protein]-cysteine S-methyltransferase [Thiocystis violacea]|uniref:methylated-DNA--[protein]-cysteine S-methyltransferase n=1 Tax=Thiocystis violacea TaxID=13725 RepID=UPI001F5B8E4A|nr:methylated-DNA--[protein]-cysteine S-methyltransferase [Thiocystis violacea]MBK1722032.1 hypothetical protein [Thiocystis violacea]